MSTEKGVSIVEVIFSVGVVILVITGAVSLIAKSTATKTSSLQRKNASEMAQIVIENLVDIKNNNQEEFWKLDAIVGGTLSKFENHSYSVGYSQVTSGSCSLAPPPTCVDAIVTINWGNDQSLVAKRFFSK